MMIYFFSISYSNIVERDSAVGIATGYGVDSTGIESLWGAVFSATIQADPVVHAAYYAMRTGSFLGINRPESGVDHPSHLAPSLKKV